ncbi:MAG: type II toxin-antitoxin system VapB family antitoxin [Deltaproteobacteria bacterium]|nr:type II toxin-antitoxin system VapB family antitoxin [Deltaproteobacteria bacterium]
MNIPKQLLQEAVKVSGATTQTMAVVLGLEELIRRKRLETLLQLKGSGALGLSQRSLKRMRRR